MGIGRRCGMLAGSVLCAAALYGCSNDQTRGSSGGSAGASQADDDVADDGTEVDDDAAADNDTPADDDTPSGDDSAADDDTPSDDDSAIDDDTPADDDSAAGDDTPADDDSAAGDDTLADDDSAAGDDTPADGDSAAGDDTPADDDSAIGDDTLADDDSAAGDDTPADDDGAADDDTVVRTTADKLDLLFMIDNSQSMADKQQILAQAVPQLVIRLLNPPCVDENGNAVGVQPATPNDVCVEGSREYEPIADIHIGVISSSLGGVGGSFCETETAADANPTTMDMAHLMGTVRDTLVEDSDGFLNWDNRDPALAASDSTPDAPPISDFGTLIARFADHVVAVGEVGCGFESSLESWYRFLIDPAPYQRILIPDPATGQGVKDGVDQELLDQRAMFLRSDSRVVVVMVTDENDCSIRAGGLGSLVATFNRDNSIFLMRRGTSVCETSPNDPCCFSCATDDSAWPSSCGTKEQLCLGTEGEVEVSLTYYEDASNLRCYKQKQRFGIDFLYPTSRYTVGLRSAELCPDSSFGDADCQCAKATKLGATCKPGAAVDNPLYSPGTTGVVRDPSLVFLAGIIGVPWQLIATDDTATTETPSLRYKTSADIDWAAIVGDSDGNVLPTSLHMQESILPREGLPGPDAGPTADPVNGHEWNTDGKDLQYACIFELPVPRDCATVEQGRNCDCFPSADVTSPNPTEDVENARKPVCQDMVSGVYTTTQYRAKAYPGLRELEVLRDYGDNAITTSVCPKTLSGVPEADASYGYNPALSAIVGRLKGKLGR